VDVTSLISARQQIAGAEGGQHGRSTRSRRPLDSNPERCQPARGTRRQAMSRRSKSSAIRTAPMLSARRPGRHGDRQKCRVVLTRRGPSKKGCGATQRHAAGHGREARLGRTVASRPETGAGPARADERSAGRARLECPGAGRHGKIELGRWVARPALADGISYPLSR